MIEQLINETIESLLEFIPKVIDETTKASDAFQLNKEASGLKMIVDLFEGYIWITDALKALGKNGVLTSIDTLGINEVLKEMEQALSMQDFVVLSDLLEYEINELLQLWNKEIIKYAQENIHANELGNHTI